MVIGHEQVLNYLDEKPEEKNSDTFQWPPIIMLERMAELLYEESMRSENWTDIVPFREISREYRDDLISLATKLYTIVASIKIIPTGGGL